MSRPDDYVPVAITDRNGIDESIHHGVVVALAADGSVAWSAGDPSVDIFPRSSNKPMQAVAMVRRGLELPPELLALVCASHDGLPMHLDGARRILASAGLDESALANTVDLPINESAAAEVLRHGGGKTALQMNCSGKHSGMLATCVANGWAHDPSYLHLDHPLQETITATMSELVGEPLPGIGVDGCGAPAHVMSMIGLARGFRSIATGTGAAERAVYEAMTTHPDMVGGPERDVTRLMRHIPGLMAKDGAEGVFAAAFADGRAVALKIADGANRARPSLMVAALAHLGVDTTELAGIMDQPVMGHGHRVGHVRIIV